MVNQSRNYLISVSLSLFLAATHYLLIADLSNSKSTSNKEYAMTQFAVPIQPEAVSDKELAKLFGFKYVEPSAASATGSESDVTDTIMLDQVTVRIRAISSIGDEPIVFLSYKEGDKGEEIQVKLRKNENVLGFTLIEANKTELVFSNQDSVVTYKIFKHK